jgi:dihydroorotate dehydrogenase
MYQALLKPLLFRQDAESAHDLLFRMLPLLLQLPGARAWARQQFRHQHPALETQAIGLRFPNPVGLAAGLDKNALLLDYWADFGFGFVEIGTVTPRPQAGNPKPRLFRLPADQALLNRMGFNNDGAEAIAPRLAQRPADLILGANIGKNKDTPNDTAEADYVRCFDALHAYSNYFVVNVSSPNTPGLRALQEKSALRRILLAVQARNQALPSPKPLLLKIAPDLNEAEIEDVVSLVPETGLAGLIATNTTVSRAGLQTPTADVEALGAGGLSGAPLCGRAQAVMQQLAGRGFDVIGVGGITTATDALQRRKAGAALVQVYSGLVYQGPALVGQICDAWATHPPSNP